MQNELHHKMIEVEDAIRKREKMEKKARKFQLAFSDADDDVMRLRRELRQIRAEQKGIQL